MEDQATLQYQLDLVLPHITSLPDGSVRNCFMAAVQRIRAQIELAPATVTPVVSPAGAAAAPPPHPTDASSQDGSIGSLYAAAVTGAGINVRSRFEALALAVHCMLLEQGFVCTGSDAVDRNMPGFAAPAREVPRSVLVPPGWNADAGVVSFRYSHGGARGKSFVVKVICLGDEGAHPIAEVHGSVYKQSEVSPVSINVSDIIPAVPHTDAQALFSNTAGLHTLHTIVAEHIAYKFVPGLAPVATPATQPEMPSRDYPQPPSYGYPSSGLLLPRVPNPAYPYSGLPSSPFTDPLHAGGVAGGGLFVGPDSALFGMGRGHMPFGVPPGARFDPFGPDGPDFGTLPDGTRQPGRGRGSLPFSGPNPDHLKPPGF